VIQGTEPIRVKRGPSGSKEAAVVHLFMSPTAFPVQFRRSIGWRRKMEVFCQPGIKGALQEWGGICNVPHPGSRR
jgi:hypothetical protein